MNIDIGRRAGPFGPGVTEMPRDGRTPTQPLAGIARLYEVPAATIAGLVVAGATLGVIGDVLLRAPDGPVGLNLSLWVAAVACAAILLQRRATIALDRERAVWLTIGVVFAAGLAWRDAAP